jgi:hypothetical protein
VRGEKGERRVSLTIRVPVSVAEALRALAAADRRSVSAFLRIELERLLARRKQKP